LAHKKSQHRAPVDVAQDAAKLLYWLVKLIVLIHAGHM
jgi:hypothetical protein